MADTSQTTLQKSITDLQDQLNKMNQQNQVATDAFAVQKNAIDTLTSVLSNTSGPAPTFVQPIQTPAATPNYMLYIAIGAIVVFLYMRIRK